MYKKIFLSLLIVAGTIATIVYAHTDTTIRSRLRIAYPDLGYEGGASLHANQVTMVEKIGNSLNSRYEEFSAIPDSTTVTQYHNFGVAFSELTILIYTGSGTDLTRVADPVAAGWTIAANSVDPKLKVDITTPASGGPHTFAVIVIHGSAVETIDDLDDVDISTTAPEDGQALVWDGSQFIPGASGDSSLKLQSIVGTDLNIKQGYLILSDGRELRLASDLVYDLSGVVVDDDYYVYIDLSLLPVSPTNLNGRLVYDLTSGMFTLKTETADLVNNSQFVYLGTLQRSGGTWQNQQTGAFRRHDLSTGEVKGNTYSLTASQVDALFPITHNLASVPHVLLQVSDGTDYEYHEVGAYFKSDSTEIKSTGTTLASVFGASTPVIFTYSSGTPTIFVPNKFWFTVVKSASDAALSGQEIFADTSGGAITLTFPLTPVSGDKIRVVDYDGSWDTTNKVVLNGNGKNINGNATLDLDVANDSVELVYNGVEWRVL